MDDLSLTDLLPPGRSPGSAGGPPASTSALYNMALVSTPQKSIPSSHLGYSFNKRVPRKTYDVSGVHVDKLRLGFITMQKAPDFQILGGGNRIVTRGKNRGRIESTVCKVWTKSSKEDGGVYWQCTTLQGMTTSYVILEYNPAKMADEDYHGLRATLDLYGVRDRDQLFVERYDCAFDYKCKRRELLLHDPRRVMDCFGLGAQGPETERTGFRRGSRLKFQLYDKTAERASKGVDIGDRTRFEVQVLKPESFETDSPLFAAPAKKSSKKPAIAAKPRLKLRDLPSIAYPGKGVYLRCFPFHPLRIRNVEFACFAATARGMGMRFAQSYARRVCGWPHRKWEQFAECVTPLVDPSPEWAWASGWRQTATAAVVMLCGSRHDAPSVPAR